MEQKYTDLELKYEQKVMILKGVKSELKTEKRKGLLMTEQREEIRRLNDENEQLKRQLSQFQSRDVQMNGQDEDGIRSPMYDEHEHEEDEEDEDEEDYNE